MRSASREAARHHERSAIALALEQCVGRDRRAHLHDFDLRLTGIGFAVRDPEQVANPLNRRIGVVLGVLREKFAGDADRPPACAR